MSSNYVKAWLETGIKGKSEVAGLGMANFFPAALRMKKA